MSAGGCPCVCPLRVPQKYFVNPPSGDAIPCFLKPAFFQSASLARPFNYGGLSVWGGQFGAKNGEGLGSGGGHDEKAGGYISAQKFADAFPGLSIEAYFTPAQMLNTGKAGVYEKLPIQLSYVPCADILPLPAMLYILMLEGDIVIPVEEDIYLMMGLHGEVYPITRKKFQATNTELSDTRDNRVLDKRINLNFAYTPVVLNRDHGSRILLDTVARACVGKGGGRVQALLLSKGLKLFIR